VTINVIEGVKIFEVEVAVTKLDANEYALVEPE